MIDPNTQFLHDADDYWEAHEIKWEMRERKIEDLVDQYEQDMSYELMGEVMQEEEITEWFMKSWKAQNWSDLGSAVDQMVKKYLYRLAEMETD